MKIENVHILNKKYLKAVFDLVFPSEDLIIKGMKYYQKEDNRSWISFPTQKVEVENEPTKYFYHAFWTPEARHKKNEEVMKMLKQQMDKMEKFEDKIEEEMPDQINDEDIPF